MVRQIALKFFIDRQGKQVEIFSDSGTNFMGVNNFLKSFEYESIGKKRKTQKISSESFGNCYQREIPPPGPMTSLSGALPNGYCPRKERGCQISRGDPFPTKRPLVEGNISLEYYVNYCIILRKETHQRINNIAHPSVALQFRKFERFTMENLSYTVRLMTKEDVPQTLEVWRSTGMQEGTHCLYTWLEVDKEAFNVAVTDSGEIIGVCCAVIHHPNFAFVGVYAVLEKYRGYGVGKKVWDACMKHIGTINVALNAVPGKLELYRDKGGFPIVESRWTCVVNETEEPINHEALSNEVPDGIDIVPFQESHLLAIFEYDFALIGYDRKLAVELNCKEFDSKTFVAIKGDNCVGFGTIKRSCHNVGQVGPLYADDPAVAEVMLRKLIESHTDVKGFAMMTISSNAPANDFIKKIGCPTTEECPRLYKKEKVEVDTDKVFAHFDLNFSPY
ncbi:n-acetyltransferase domain-containing protein [Nephila pilipes]|uniref:N-acetyltransferase domain-containing protein n=1 Tax=Nephila pilipes TaxID=299642 RepID=A0A8X6UNF1_NEPPI|nr:n-acetyltransferase domain-containing protein [Nephila pilipes]